MVLTGLGVLSLNCMVLPFSLELPGRGRGGVEGRELKPYVMWLFKCPTRCNVADSFMDNTSRSALLIHKTFQQLKLLHSSAIMLGWGEMAYDKQW